MATLFVTADFGVLLQDCFALEAPLEALLGVQVPRLFFTRVGAATTKTDDLDSVKPLKRLYITVNQAIEDAMGGAQQQKTSQVVDAEGRGLGDVGLCSRVMRDFVGLDDSDDEARKALLDFSYYLTVGNMDEAHRAVRLIKSASVWENMAHIRAAQRGAKSVGLKGFSNLIPIFVLGLLLAEANAPTHYLGNLTFGRNGVRPALIF